MNDELNHNRLWRLKYNIDISRTIKSTVPNCQTIDSESCPPTPKWRTTSYSLTLSWSLIFSKPLLHLSLDKSPAASLPSLQIGSRLWTPSEDEIGRTFRPMLAIKLVKYLKCEREMLSLRPFLSWVFGIMDW